VRAPPDECDVERLARGDAATLRRSLEVEGARYGAGEHIWELSKNANGSTFLTIISVHGCRSRPCCPQLAFTVALELNRLVKTPAAATRVVSPCDDRET
jgi:hypothetical protein